jgi:sigma-B regulation protein RsbU (phosphoserine phosphatase)
MTPHSLRSKIFLLLTGTLLVIAIFIVFISQFEVSKALSDTEIHAMENAITLAERNLEAGWNVSLDDKIHMVRNERAYLMETGELIFSALDGSQRATGDDARRQRLGADWIDRLPPDPLRHFFAYDAQFKVRASNRPDWIGQDISALRDFKGQPLARSMYDESRRFRYGFAMYRTRGQADEPSRTYHGSFVYVKDWDWVIVIARDGQGIAEQIAAKKMQMETELQDGLGTMQLARSGFMFAVADDGHFVAPPSGPNRNLVDAAFLERLRARVASDLHDKKDELKYEGDKLRCRRASCFDTRLNEELWHVEYHYFKPLGWTLAALVPESDLLLPAKNLIERQIVVFAVVLFCAWIGAFLVIARIVAPLSLLASFVQRLPEQDWTTEENKAPAAIAALPGRFHDEIGQLATAFLFMNDKLRENITQLMQETSRRGRIESELSIAHDIQFGLLPVPLEAEAQKRIDVAASMTPSKEVGGDLYDYFLLPDKKTLCFVIGDVSGKGVPAALFMAITRTLVRSTAEVEIDPARLLAAVNNRIAENNPNLMFVTLLVGMLNIETGQFIWANAGHPPPFFISPAGNAGPLVGRSGPACGVMENVRYRTFTYRFSAGETLFGYTDGVTEAFDTAGTQYGGARLRTVLAHTGSTGSIRFRDAETTLSHVNDDIEIFAVGAEQFDDITMLAVRFL